MNQMRGKSFLIIRIFIFLIICAYFLCLNVTPPAAAEKVLTVGVIEIEKVMEEWPKFQSYSDQTLKEEIAYSILFEKASPNMTETEKSEMQYQITKILDHSNFILMEVLTNDMSIAAEQIAIDKELDMVLIKNRVRSGGINITDDLMKVLK